MKVTYVAPLLAVGILLGYLRPGAFTEAFGHATLWIFLPALIFDAAWELDWTVARRLWKPIALLAFPGVVLTAAIVAAAAHVAGALPLAPALLLGAIVSATDPIAVVALFRTLGVPTGLGTIVECESLLNDAVAVVLYRVLLAGAGSAALIVASPAARGIFALVGSVSGVIVGVAGALLVGHVLLRNAGAVSRAIATFAGAYAVYYGAEHFDFSGIFAVIAFGAALRMLEGKRLPPEAVRGIGRTWQWAVGAANAVLFFLIGTALDIGRLLHEPRLLLATLGGAAVARILLTHVVLPTAVRPVLPRSWLEAINLAGVRGALALALAIATPATLPFRGAIIDATFCVVVVTLFASSVALKGRLRRLGLSSGQ